MGNQKGVTLLEILFVLILLGIITRMVIARFPSFAIVCAGVDTVSENLASDMRLAKSLSQNEQKDYAVEFFSNNAPVECYDYATGFQYNRYQLIDKSDGSIYKNETKNFPSKVTGRPGTGSDCLAATKSEQKFIFSSDGTERTQASLGQAAAGDTIRIQGETCPRYYNISVTPSTGQITITKVP